MRIARISAAALAALCLAVAPAYAGQKGKGGGSSHGNPHTPPAAAPTVTHPPSPSPTPKTHGNPHTSSATPTPKTHDRPRTSSATPTPTTHSTTDKKPKTHGNSKHDGDRTPTVSSATPTTSNAPTPTDVNPIAAKLQGKPLGARIEHMLPTGMTLNTASAGFRNQGQFIAAVHASQNLGIPFAALKAAMIGTPTQPGLSLGQAIHQLKPFANPTTEASRAEHEAERDLASPLPTTSSTPTTSATPTTSSATPTTSSAVPRPSSVSPTPAKTKKRGK